MNNENFQPKIIAFLCNWCSYAGADLAGVSRLQYPANIRIQRVMCTGRIDINFILEAFLAGADGVLISGCHPGECHYITGNLMAKRRVEFVRNLVESIGINPKRLRLEWVSASEGKKFQKVVEDFVAEIKELGASPLRYRSSRKIKLSKEAEKLPPKRRRLIELILQLSAVSSEQEKEKALEELERWLNAKQG